MDNSVDKCEFLWIVVGGSKVHVQLFSVDVNCQFFAEHSYHKLHSTPKKLDEIDTQGCVAITSTN